MDVWAILSIALAFFVLTGFTALADRLRGKA